MRDIRFLLQPKYSNSRALIIGIDQYKTTSPLTYAVNDAVAVHDSLRDEFDFPADNLILLTNAAATSENILRSFLSFTAPHVGLDERIVLFFAGHGFTRTGYRGEVGYLMAYDTDATDLTTYIRWDQLTRECDLIRAKHVLFIMDACYGGLAITRAVAPGSARFLKDMMRRYSRQVLTAGKADEVVADSGGPLVGHSIFTGHLIEGLKGEAANEQGIISANGLMAYVAQRVSTDNYSNQTPHYGYVDGDGDFIFNPPESGVAEDDDKKEIDQLVVMPFADVKSSPLDTEDKISAIKELLPLDSSLITLHDFLVDEVRRFLSLTNEDHFPPKQAFSPAEFLDRVNAYESAVFDLASLMSCLAYWARPQHQQIIRKVFARSTDRLPEVDNQSWASFKWYPIAVMFYFSGVSAVVAERYDSLHSIFYSNAPRTYHWKTDMRLVGAMARKIDDLREIFKRMPGHEHHFVPVSEYLYKAAQPKLEDVLHIGKDYENAFDRFEIIFGLSVVDFIKQDEGNSLIPAPAGRFGWKRNQRNDHPYAVVIKEAQSAGDTWPPLKAGLFGGSLQRFNEAIEALDKSLKKRRW